MNLDMNNKAIENFIKNPHMDTMFLCKGKSVESGNWIIGYLTFHKTGKVFIKPVNGNALNSEEVDPKSICRSLNIYDDNKKLCFENDIVEFKNITNGTDRYLLWWNNRLSFMSIVSLETIFFNGKDFLCDNQKHISNYESFSNLMAGYDAYEKNYSEKIVIGNLFDNEAIIEKALKNSAYYETTKLYIDKYSKSEEYYDDEIEF